MFLITSILSKSGARIKMRMRKKRHGSERLLALSALIYPECEEGWIPAADVFGCERPLKLEVGCGKGDFITKLSEVEPDCSYIALERISDVAVCAMEKYAGHRGLGHLGTHGGWETPDGALYKGGDVWDMPMESRGNVRFIVGEAGDVITKMPDHTLDAVIANFSDPWSRKANYQKRRLTHPAYLESYRRVLKPDGLFSFKTDNDVLFDYTLEMLPEAGFEIVFETRDLHHSERAETNIVTEYERNFTEKGIDIKMVEARPKR